MAKPVDDETSVERLLYDDTAPRLRRPINPTVLKFRRPSFLFMPLTVVIAAVIAGAIATFGIAGSSAELPVIAGVFAGFFLLIMVLALVFSRREEDSYALLTPNLVSLAHAMLLIGFVVAIVMPGALSAPTVQGILAGLPGPQLESPQLELFKAYCILFVVITVASVVGALVVRLIGFRRVVAGTA